MRQLDAYAATVAELRAEVEHRLKRDVMYSRLHDEDVATIDTLRRENERLAMLIREHNEGIESCCGRVNAHNANLKGCADYIRRGRECPDCPRDFLIALDAATQGVPA